jgi:thioredoxin 1
MLIVKKYFATWCQPCKQLALVFEELKNEMANKATPVVFQTIDVDQNRESAAQNNVSGVPTVILEKNGQEVHRFTGVIPKQSILNLINQFS